MSVWVRFSSGPSMGWWSFDSVLFSLPAAHSQVPTGHWAFCYTSPLSAWVLTFLQLLLSPLTVSFPAIILPPPLKENA